MHLPPRLELIQRFIMLAILSVLLAKQKDKHASHLHINKIFHNLIKNKIRIENHSHAHPRRHIRQIARI